MDLNEKIKKTTEDIERLQEKLKNKKKELAMLESKKQEQEQRERISRNEKFISRIEEKIGGNVTDLPQRNMKNCSSFLKIHHFQIRKRKSTVIFCDSSYCMKIIQPKLIYCTLM